MSSGEVAERLGLHPVAVWRIPRDLLGYEQRGPRSPRRYNPADVDRYRTSQQPGPTLAAQVADHEQRIRAIEQRLREEPPCGSD